MESFLYVLFCFFWWLVIFLLSLFLWKEITMGIYIGKTQLEGKLVVITGGNCGIGLETARDLASRGARVIMGCRNRERGESAVKDVITSTGNSMVEMVELDLLSLESVRRFAQEISARPEPLHILINNAGMVDARGAKTWAIGKSHLSDDGLEIVTQTNHLSHFLLTNLLRERLVAAANSRVINVSSMAAIHGHIHLDNINYERDSSAKALHNTYHSSKLMNVMFTKEISRRWAHLGITSYSLHPGTEVFRDFSPIIRNLIHIYGYLTGKGLWQGAQTTIFLACQPNIENQTGSYFGDCRNWNFLLPRRASDSSLTAGLWERSAELVQLDM